MQPERQYAAAVLTGLAAFALCFALRASPPVIVAAGVVYAAAGYYTAEHPDVLRGRGGGLESGVLAAVSTFGMFGVLEGADSWGMVVLAFGLICFAFANGAAYARGDGG